MTRFLTVVLKPLSFFISRPETTVVFYRSPETTVVFLSVVVKKNIRGTTVVFIGRPEKKHEGYHCRLLSVVVKNNMRGTTVVFYRPS